MKTRLSKWLKSGATAKTVSATVLMLFTFAGIFFFQQMLQIKTHYSLKQFQPKTHPLLEEDKRLKARFGLTETTPYIVLLESTTEATWVEPKSLSELADLTKKVSQLDEVSDIKSLANIETAITDEQSFTVGPIRDIAQNPDYRSKILSDPLIAPHLVSNDGKIATLIVAPKRLTLIQQADFLKKVENITQKKPHLYSARVSGPNAVSNQIATILQKELVLYSALSLLVSALIFFIIFRNLTVVPMGLILVIAGNVISMGTLSFLGITLNVLSSTLPIIITLTVVSIATQCLSRLAEFKNKVLHNHRHLLIYKVKRDIIKSHWIATACTAIGFAALIESDTPIIRAYGLSVAISVMVTCAVTIILQFALIVWFPLPVKRKFGLTSEWSLNFISKYRHALFTGITLTCLLLALMGRNLNWSTVLFADLPSQSDGARDIALVDQKLGGSIPLDISIGKPGQKDVWKDLKNIQKLDELVTTWRNKPGISSVVGLPDFLKATNNERRIASSTQALSETYFIFSMANENPLQNFLTNDGSYTRVMMRTIDIPSSQTEAIIAEFKHQTEKAFPGYTFEASGMAATVHPINENLSRELIFGFYTAMLWILLMLLFVFRSVRWTLFSAIPNLVPPSILLGGLAITQTPIKPAIAIIFAISLGIAFNNTVYVLLKLKKLVDQGKLNVLPVDVVMRGELGPCFISSCAVMAGFSVFLFSDFSMNQTFGSFMIFSVVAGLLGDLVLLPTLLYIFPGLLLPRVKSETISEHEEVRLDFMTPSTQKYVAGLLIVLGVGLISQKAFSATTPDVQDILKNVQKANMTPYEQVELTMKIKESDGSTKERTLSIKKKSDTEQKAMVKLMSPSDLKGVGLLTVSTGKGGDENQWLYLPSEKRSRRIVGSNKKGRFLDSELNYEDLRASTYESFNNKILETKKDGTKEIAIIESNAKSDSESSYSKIKTWIDITTYRILKTEYYGEDGKLLKIMTFTGYKKYKNNLWRAQNISVKNVKKNRSTTLEMKKFSMKKMTDGDFSMSALEEL